jgi:DNA-binding NarL/FixJ family response regulator
VHIQPIATTADYLERPLRVILADDHALLLDSLALYLSRQPTIEVVAQARSSESLLLAAQQHDVDVVVMDLSMPGLDPYRRLQLLQRLRKPAPAVLILTSSMAGFSLQDLLQAGARGYLPKDADGQQLIAAIRAVAQGKIHVHGEGNSSLVNQDSSAQRLSQREQQLLSLMAQGHSNIEISKRLLLSIGTVKSYSSRLFDKIGVRDRTQAALLAMRHGWCSVPPAEPTN